MGGKGSGRLNKTDAFLKRNSDPYKSVGNVASVGNEVLVIPNHSGMLDAGKVHRTPTDDLDPVNKKYVDDIAVGSSFDFYAYDDASDIATYKEFKLTPSPDAEVEGEISIPGNATAEPVGVRITEDIINIKELMTEISAGVWLLHVHLRAATAGRLRFYAELYTRTSLGVETLISTSEITDLISNTGNDYNAHGSIQTAIPLVAGDRIVVKAYASNKVAAATSLFVTVEGDTATRVSITGLTSPINHASLVNLDYASAGHTGFSQDTHEHEGTAIKSTGEGGGTKFLREDGDGTCSWQAGGGEVIPVKSGVIFYAPFNRSVNAAYSEGSGTGTLTTGNLSGIWHMEEGTGNAADESGKGNTLTNNAAWTADGKYGSATDYLIANTDYLEGATLADTDFSPNTSDFSVGVWLKDAASVASQNVFGMEGTDTWRFLIRNTTGNMQFFVQDATENIIINRSDLDARDGDWHFYVMTFDNSTGTLSVYSDGVFRASNVNTNVVAINPTNKIAVGRRNSTADRYLTGTVDEPFFIKGTALTADEVTLLYENRWWGRTYLDGKFGTGYYAFEGNSISYAANDGNIIKDKGTISMWVKPSWDGDDGINHILFDMRTAPTNQNRLVLRKTTADKLDFTIGESDGTLKAVTLAVTSANIATNTWNHIAITWNAGTMALYLNGASVGSGSGVGTGKLLKLDTTFKIGRHSGSTSSEAKTIFDELTIYDRDLTATEILQNYEATQPLSL